MKYKTCSSFDKIFIKGLIKLKKDTDFGVRENPTDLKNERITHLSPLGSFSNYSGDAVRARDLHGAAKEFKVLPQRDRMLIKTLPLVY